MKTRMHAVAGAIALFTILSFWSATLIAELFLSPDAVTAVKRAIVYGLLILIPALAMAGATGLSLAKSRSGTLITKKKKRMPVVALNGLLIMAPAAFFLQHKATAGEFDILFYSVQVLELAIGLIQLSLLGLNFRDGLRIAGRLRPSCS